MSCRRIALALCAGLLISSPGLAAGAMPESRDTAAAVMACRSLPDGALRLQCYDREADRLLPRPIGSAPTEPTPVEPRAAAAATPSPATPQAMADAAPAAPSTGSLGAAVTALDVVHGKGIAFRLDNGQVWEQLNDEGRCPVRAGDLVRIRRLLMGTYLLVGPSGWSTKVRLRT